MELITTKEEQEIIRLFAKKLEDRVNTCSLYPFAETLGVSVDNLVGALILLDRKNGFVFTKEETAESWYNEIKWDLVARWIETIDKEKVAYVIEAGCTVCPAHGIEVNANWLRYLSGNETRNLLDATADYVDILNYI